MIARNALALLLLVASATPVASAAPASAAVPTLAEELQSFAKDSRAFMNAAPTRFRADGHNETTEAASKAPWEAKVALRKALMAAAERRAGEHRPHAEPLPEDQASDVVGNLTLLRLTDMEPERTASVPVSPWSGDYWAVYKGGLSKRYADTQYPSDRDWKVNYDYLLSVLGLGQDPSTLSPAEKYDLLVGDSNWTLSHEMQENGWQYYSGPRTVPTWVGYCHGWASAAYEVPRPAQTVIATAPDGTKIPFYPDDIKALETALWGDYALSGQIRMAGTRCESSDPAEDANGRIIEPACFDNNPATWHLAVVNQLGVGKKSLTFDAALDAQVWNQPAQGYTYSYFNPETLLPAPTLAEATVAAGAFTSDRFKAYRSARATSFVGIAMDLTYLDETNPSNKGQDQASDDLRETVRYLYDLELDDTGAIIGGEWYRNHHPDFLWTPTPGARPWTDADRAIEETSPSTWDPALPVPPDWLSYLPGTSSAGVPAATIVEALNAKSQPSARSQTE